MRESFKTEYKASVKIDPTSEPYLPHNDRTDNKAKNIYKDMSHENEYHIFSDNGESVKDMHERLYQEAKSTYMAKSKRPDKFTDKKATLVEAVYELTPETTKEQVIKLTQEIAKITGFTPLHIAIHKDEGHTTENGTFQKHYHAHAVFFTLDKDTGKQLKRQKAALTKENLAKMQDLATEHLSTSNYQMTRGERRYEYNKSLLQNGGNKEDCKKVVYEKSIKDYAKNQAMKLRENQITNKSNDLRAKEQDIANREYEQNIKDKRADQVLNKINENLYKEATGFFKSMFKDFKTQDLRTIMSAICEEVEKNNDKREQEIIKQAELKNQKTLNDLEEVTKQIEAIHYDKGREARQRFLQNQKDLQNGISLTPKLSKQIKDFDWNK